MNNPFLSRFSSEPALLEPSMQDRFESCMNMLAKTPRIDELMSERMDSVDFWFSSDDWRSAYRPYVVVNGILQIPVKGVLLNEFPWAIGKWATGYEYIWQAVKRGMADPDVSGIALLIDSPGGMVAGCFTAVDRIFDLRDQKPIRCYANESAYSAAYAFASLGPINVSRTGGVGSIGVVLAHVDISAAMDKAGYKITFIFAGDHKVDGNPYQALPKDVKDRLQARIDEMYGIFVSTVARNRPALSEDEVRATQALCFTASQAISAKLADSVGDLDDALAAFADDLDNPEDITEDEQMAQNANNTTPAAASSQPAPEATVTASAHAQAVEQARAEGHSAGLKEGMEAASARISAILGCDEAKGRESQALTIATKTNMSADDAKVVLASAPASEPAAAAAPNAFEQAMEKGNPNVSAVGGGDETQAKDDVEDIFASAGMGRKSVA